MRTNVIIYHHCHQQDMYHIKHLFWCFDGLDLGWPTQIFLMSLTVLCIKTSKQNINIGVKLIFDKTQMLKMLPYSHIINFDVKHMKQKCLWSSTKYQIGVTKVTKDMWILIISWWNQKSYLSNIYSQLRFSYHLKHSYRMWFLE